MIVALKPNKNSRLRIGNIQKVINHVRDFLSFQSDDS